MNIESVRTVATSTERNGQPERKTAVTKVAEYDSATTKTATGLSSDKRVTAVEKQSASTSVDTNVASQRVPDSTAVSRPAQVLGKLRQVADTDPSAFSDLLNQGAAEIQSAVTDNVVHVQDQERMRQIMENFQQAAASQSVADLDPTKLQGSSPADNSLTTALLARADAVLGIAPAPYGPWFPRF